MMSLIFYALLPLALSQTNSVNCLFEQEFDIDTYEDLVDKAKFGNGSIDVIQTTKQLLLLDSDLNVLNSTLGPKTTGYSCNRVIGYPLGNIFFVGCQQNGSEAYLQGYQCYGLNCNPFGSIVYIPLGIQLFDKAVVVGNTFIMLQNDRVLFYTIVVQTGSWYLRTTSYIFDKSYFNRTNLYLTDFDIKSYYMDSQLVYRILITDRNEGVLWVDSIYRTNNLVPYSQGSILLRYTITTLRATTKFKSAAILKASENSTEFVISTDLEDSYQILYQSNKAILESVLNRYRDWVPIGYITLKGNAVAIPYQNTQGTIITPLYKVKQFSDSNELIQLQQDYTDLLFSSSLKHFLIYFVDADYVIYKSDTDSFTKCKLGQYNNIEQ
ncbi:unnamed protein product [Paramecium primaurelia]|uniref:Transmembrane protein n=1 Tax=Paramecium primaurelia TaxID=5886 RepID=A0A8S1JNK9_PARPR|nr:unnamed protein product [Paramecium primaurelia]